jgi:hypothetical protein
MESKDLERKLKIERVETCLNCNLFTDCDDIGRFVECEDFLKVEREEMIVIVGLDKYAKLDSIKSYSSNRLR